jgi:hypothetical protein
VHLICQTIQPTRSNWVISHLSTCHHIPNNQNLATTSPTRLPSIELCPLPSSSEMQAPSPPQPPLYHFSPWFPFSSKANALKIHHRCQAHPLLTPFLPALRPLKGTENTAVPYHTHSCMSSNEDCHPSPFISASKPIPLLCCPASPMVTPHHLPLPHRSAAVSYRGPQWSRVKLCRSGEPHYRQWMPSPW